MTNKHNPLTLQPGWAIYLRTSDADTKHSHERQRHTIERVLLLHSPLPVIETYADVESGLTPNRPEYQRLLQDARLGKFSHIAVSSPDRFGRDMEAVKHISSELQDLGIQIHFANSFELTSTHQEESNKPILQQGWAIYLRASSHDVQNPKASHERQQFNIHQYLIQPSLLPVIAVYADIESGLNPNRPEYQRLLQDARLGKFSHIAVSSLDRFGRDPAEAVQRYHELANLGIAVQVAESSHPLPPFTPTSPKEQAHDQEA